MPATEAKASEYTEYCDLVSRNLVFWEPKWRRAEEYAKFVWDGIHYADDDDDTATQRDSTMVRYTGRQTFHVYEHEVGSVSSAPISTSARPVDNHGDPELAELAVALLDSETEDPNKEFLETIEDALGCASVVGYGVARLSFEADEGPWGELMLIGVQPNCIMWDPSVKSMHSRRCRWVIEKFRMTRAEMLSQAKWDEDVIRQMVPKGAATGRTTGESDGQARVGKRNVAGAFSDMDEFDVYLIWERKPRTTKKQPRLGSWVDLEDDERYHSCTACGYRGRTQGELGFELPEVGTACPQCTKRGEMQPLMRIDAHEVVEEMLAYPDGRLTVIAPDCGADREIYSGKWPFKCRSYPYYHIQRYRHPMKTTGPSIASQNWWNQLALDLHFRIGLEREVQSSAYWLLPEVGLNDDVGERFEMSDAQGNQMYYEGETPPDVRLIEGTGVPREWNVMHQALLSGLVSHQGIADLGFGPSQSRDIAARSLEVQVEQQEIPTAHFQRRHQRELSRLLGIYFDAIRDTYPDERVVRLRGEDGMDVVRKLRAADLPNFDFVVTSAPSFTGLDEKKAKGVELLIRTMKEDPWAIDVVADVHKVAPSVVRQFKAAWKTFQQSQPQTAPTPGAGGAAPGMGQLGAPAGADAAETFPGDPMGATGAVDQLLMSLGVKQQGQQ